MSLLKEFKEFAIKGNVVDLAVAVVIGGAFGKIVTAFVSDLVMPLVNALTPGGDWRKLELTSLHFKVGDLLGTVVDFLIVAAVVFVVIQKLIGAMNKVMPAHEAPPATKQCPECLENVPKAARRCRACTSIFVALFLLFVSNSASAQAQAESDSNDAAKAEADQVAAAKAEAEKAEAAKAETAKVEAQKADAAKAEAARLDAEKAAAAVAAANAVEWKAQSKGGFLLTSGNSQTTNATFGVNASRKQGMNKLALEGVYAYGKSSNLAAVEVPSANPAVVNVVGYDRQTVVSTNNWMAKGRYDRFLTENNSLYVSGQGAGDKVAGKMFFGGGQAGYSRQLFKGKMNLVVAELGYDFSYLVFETSDPSVAVHSARAFVGETLTLTQQTGMTAGVEGLFNLNKEAKAKNASDGSDGVDPFKDTRVNAKIGISTNLHKSLSLGLGFTFKYTENPAPRPLPGNAPAGTTLVYPPLYGSYQYADHVDTLTEATLVYTFF